MIDLSPEIITIMMLGGVLVGVLIGYPLAIPVGALGLIFGFLLFGTPVFDLLTSLQADKQLCPSGGSPVCFYGSHAGTLGNRRKDVCFIIPLAQRTQGWAGDNHRVNGHRPGCLRRHNWRLGLHAGTSCPSVHGKARL